MKVRPPHYAAIGVKTANIVGLGLQVRRELKTKRNLERIADDDSKTKNTRQVAYHSTATTS